MNEQPRLTVPDVEITGGAVMLATDRSLVAARRLDDGP
jgi:hypothetical protein